MNKKALELWQECFNETGKKEKLIDLETITIGYARKINQVLIQDVLDSKGNIYAFGNAKNLGSRKLDHAVDLEVIPDFNGYYILDCFGNVYSFQAYAGLYSPEYNPECKYVNMKLV